MTGEGENFSKKWRKWRRIQIDFRSSIDFHRISILKLEGCLAVITFDKFNAS